MQPTAQALGNPNSEGQAPKGRKKRLRENALKQLNGVEECRVLRLRLLFALRRKHRSSLRMTMS